MNNDQMNNNNTSTQNELAGDEVPMEEAHKRLAPDDVPMELTPTHLAPDDAPDEVPMKMAPVELASDDASDEVPMELAPEHLAPKVRHTNEKFSRDHTIIKGRVRLSMPGDLKEPVLEKLQAIKDEAYDPDETWNESHVNSYYAATSKGALFDRINKGVWSQSIEHGDGTVAMYTPRSKSSKSKVITGNEAKYRLMDSLGTGRIGEVPLIHTGIRVKFTPPEEDAIMDYYRSLAKEKATLGRYTYGKLFSNMRILHDDLTVRFVLKHVVATTLDIKPNDIEGFLRILAPEDIPALQWGLAKAMYPEGVEYDVACGVNPATCNFLYEGMLSTDKLHFMDELNLPNECLDQLMLADNGTVTEEDVRTYREALWGHQKKTFTISTGFGNTIDVELKHSSIKEQITIGKKWVESCRKDVHEAVGVKDTDDSRAAFINSRAKITYLRQYEHYVHSIDTGNGVLMGGDISDALTSISASEKARVGVLDAVTEFIDDSQFAIIGIPKFECPTCHKTPTTPVEDRKGRETYIKEIIPIDVTQVFFTLIGIRVLRVTDRVL